MEFAEIIDDWLNGRKQHSYDRFKELDKKEKKDFLSILADDGAWYAPYMLADYVERSEDI